MFMNYAVWESVAHFRAAFTASDFMNALPWTGDETVLDIGCGRGLMLVGAARRLTTGQAVGIDLWRTEGSGRQFPRGRASARTPTGVSDPIRINTGHPRQLPYMDCSFDAVLSHWVVHNLPDANHRHQALDEMLRVWRPGGVLVLADIANIAEYRAYLTSSGLNDL